MLVLSGISTAQQDTEVPVDAATRIITLSPHLTELVFLLGKGEDIVGVSDYSDYPEQANDIVSIASYQGANIAEIMRLHPTHILVWRGGNKDADIQKLYDLGFLIHESSIQSVQDLLEDIKAIGEFIDAPLQSNTVISNINNQLSLIQKSYEKNESKALYYLNNQPLVGLGNDKWLNSLLTLCKINNIYADSLSPYPQLKMSNILRQSPNIIIAATKQNQAQLTQFWAPHQTTLKAKLISANPDALHRYTPRAIDEMQQVCKAAYR